MKSCSKCGESKSKTEFYKNKRTNDGLTAYCKECTARITKAWRQANPDRVAANSQRWRDKYPGKQAIATKKYRNKKKKKESV